MNHFERREQGESDLRQLEAMAKAQAEADQARFTSSLDFAHDRVNDLPGFKYTRRRLTSDSVGGYAVWATTVQALPKLVEEKSDGTVSLDLETQTYRRLSRPGQKYVTRVAAVFQTRTNDGYILDEKGLWVYGWGGVVGGAEDYYGPTIMTDPLPLRSVDDLHQIIKLYEDGGNYKDLRIFQPPSTS